MSVGNGVGVDMGVGVSVGNSVGVDMGVGVSVGNGVGVDMGVGVSVGCGSGVAATTTTSGSVEEHATRIRTINTVITLDHIWVCSMFSSLLNRHLSYSRYFAPEITLMTAARRQIFHMS